MRFRILRGPVSGDGPSGATHRWGPGDVIESDRDLAREEPQRFAAVGPARPFNPSVEPVPAVAFQEPLPDVPPEAVPLPEPEPEPVGEPVLPPAPQVDPEPEPEPKAEPEDLSLLRQLASEAGLKVDGISDEDLADHVSEALG